MFCGEYFGFVVFDGRCRGEERKWFCLKLFIEVWWVVFVEIVEVRYGVGVMER